MKGEEKKSLMPVPWDNMPRQPDPGLYRPHAQQSRTILRGHTDPTFSTAHAFYPFSAAKANSEEEK